MVTYDPRYMTWSQWCPLMADLFAEQQLGTAPEERWKDWASGLAGIGYFMESGVPDPRGFKTWQEWAAQMVGIMTIKAQV